MRIDKYLWCIRYFKTRSIATAACRKGAVKIKGETAKPSREVYPGDSISVRKDQVTYQIEVLDVPESRIGAKLVDIYRKDVTPQEALQTQEMLEYAKTYYRKKGVGRPTKKDRRELDDFTDPENNDD